MSERVETKRCIKALYKYSYFFSFQIDKTVLSFITMFIRHHSKIE